MLIQQGDVLIESVKKIPRSVKKEDAGERGIVLAEGEATGHAHCITDTGNAMLFRSDEEMYLEVLNECVVKHEEHGHVKVPPGKYVVRKVREYDHFAEEARDVID